MTEYVLRLQNGQDTAARVRMADLLGLTPAGALTARTGIRPAPTAGDVAAQAGTMNVTVQPFMAWVQGGVSVPQGGYVYVLDAAKTLALANGHASLSRTDVVAVVVKDDAYDGSGTYSASVQIVQGTPGAGVPALPANALPLRNVTVPANLSAGTGGLAAGNLSTDRRTYVSGLGGVVTVASQAERDALPATKGTVVYRSDTDVLEARKASGWVTLQTSDKTPLGVLGYAEVTADQTGLAGTTSITGLSVTFTAVAGRRYRATAKCSLQSAAAGINAAIAIREGAVDQQVAEGLISTQTATSFSPVRLYSALSAGAHTFTVISAFSGGSGHINRASAGSPSFLVVEDIGPV